MPQAQPLFDPTSNDPEEYVPPYTFEEEAAMIAEAEDEVAAGKIVRPDQFEQMLAAMAGKAAWPDIAD